MWLLHDFNAAAIFFGLIGSYHEAVNSNFQHKA